MTTKDSNTKVIIRKADRIEFILSGMCNYYDITRDELLKKARTPEKYKRKAYVVKLLRDIADLSFKEIKWIYGNTGENSVWVIHSRITEAIDSRCDFDALARKEYKKILNFLEI
jgi:chromosomal replication initiation ATPase DnaA